MTISQRANDVRSRMRQAVVGDLVFASELHDGHLTVLNYDGQAVQSDTITVDTAANDTAYTVTIDDIDVSYTSDATATKTEIADGLAAAINAEPLVRGRVDAVSDAVDTITLTGLLPGESYTLTETDANLSTASVTTASEASEVEFGRLMIVKEDTDEGEASGVLAAASAFTAQVDTLTPSGYVAGAEIFVSVSVDGWFDYIAEATMATDLATSLTALVGVLNDLLPASSILAASTGTAITLTAELAGLDFDVSAGTGDGGATNPTWTVGSTKSRSTSLRLSAAGISRRVLNQPTNTSGVPVYAANDQVLAIEKGAIWIEKDAADSISKGGRCYVELNAAGENGRLYPSKTATRIPLPKNVVQYDRDARSNSGDLIAGVVCDFSN